MTAPNEPTNPSELFTPFLPSTYTVPEDLESIRSFLAETLSNIVDVLNDKKIGSYIQDSENFNGEEWAYDTTKKIRNGYQSILRIPSFVSGTYDMPINNVNPQFVISKIWGSASKPCTATGQGDGDYFSFLNQGNANIQFTMSDLQILITATGPMSAYSGFIIIEYIRDGI